MLKLEWWYLSTSVFVLYCRIGDVVSFAVGTLLELLYAVCWTPGPCFCTILPQIPLFFPKFHFAVSAYCARTLCCCCCWLCLCRSLVKQSPVWDVICGYTPFFGAAVVAFYPKKLWASLPHITNTRFPEKSLCTCALVYAVMRIERQLSFYLFIHSTVFYTCEVPPEEEATIP
jgi:hypothetical protein